MLAYLRQQSVSGQKCCNNETNKSEMAKFNAFGVRGELGNRPLAKRAALPDVGAVNELAAKKRRSIILIGRRCDMGCKSGN